MQLLVIMNSSESYWPGHRGRRPERACKPEQEERYSCSRRVLQLVSDQLYKWICHQGEVDSHRDLRYQYPDDPKDLGKSVSGAEFVEDVNEVWCIKF